MALSCTHPDYILPTSKRCYMPPPNPPHPARPHSFSKHRKERRNRAAVASSPRSALRRAPLVAALQAGRRRHRSRMVGLRWCAYSVQRSKIKQALVPPKPKELDMTRLTVISLRSVRMFMPSASSTSSSMLALSARKPSRTIGE